MLYRERLLYVHLLDSYSFPYVLMLKLKVRQVVRLRAGIYRNVLSTSQYIDLTKSFSSRLT